MSCVFRYVSQNTVHKVDLMSSDPLTPYHKISPDSALQALGAPVATGGFAEIADACRRGRDDLAGRELDDRGQKTLRRFSTWEITKYLIPVATAHFRRVLRQYPNLPQVLTETDAALARSLTPTSLPSCS